MKRLKWYVSAVSLAIVSVLFVSNCYSLTRNIKEVPASEVKPFSIIPVKNTQVKWQGSTLIVSDYISYFDLEDFRQRAKGL